MPGKQITNRQEKLYMTSRQSGYSQEVSAAKAGISERSGRMIEQGKRHAAKKRNYRTRPDPFATVWETELMPLLASAPELQPIMLLEYLQNKYPSAYPDSKLRTLERRVKKWKALNGEGKEVMFRQEHLPGRQGISDFTQLKDMTITIKQVSFKHLLYHFRLSYSGWSHLKIIQGGESYTALAEGLQQALWRLGGVPLEHRTDSLSAAFKNLSKDAQLDITKRYESLCEHYGMKATRNNPGKSHENGGIESPHGHIKRRIKQSLLLRGSCDFESIAAYQEWLNEVVQQHNIRNSKFLDIERKTLQTLPTHKTADFTEICVRVSSSSTISVRRSLYTVPSRLIGEHLRIHLYDNRLECYLGIDFVISLSRVYSTGRNLRARNVDYRHVIHSLVKKPQAFRYSSLRDDLLPNENYRRIWEHIIKTRENKMACKFMVGILEISAEHDCESILGEDILFRIEKGLSLSLVQLQQHYGKTIASPPNIIVQQHCLLAYNDLILPSTQEAHYG